MYIYIHTYIHVHIHLYVFRWLGLFHDRILFWLGFLAKETWIFGKPMNSWHRIRYIWHAWSPCYRVRAGYDTCVTWIVWMTWLNHVFDMTHWHIDRVGMTHLYVCHDSIHVRDMTRSCARRDSCMCMAFLIHVCDMPCSYVRYDSFIWGTWLIHMWNMTHAYIHSRTYTHSYKVAKTHRILKL